MDLSKNPTQNVYSNELETDFGSKPTMHNSVEDNENIRKYVEQINTLGALSDRRMQSNELDNGVIKSKKESVALEKPVLVPENLIGSQKEKTEVVGEGRN
ncbi:hypothetical protein EVAR_67589_1 [Eumeta japonica]|uniref:Uncharacterized protein n=1 Tax=Eumeta variegata TaxID=151549 RepID=A0A4C1SIL5_EUMVA|nr:hypothetical protein EVAR_67589_1 [Eumeta japonica]